MQEVPIPTMEELDKLPIVPPSLRIIPSDPVPTPIEIPVLLKYEAVRTGDMLVLHAYKLAPYTKTVLEVAATIALPYSPLAAGAIHIGLYFINRALGSTQTTVSPLTGGTMSDETSLETTDAPSVPDTKPWYMSQTIIGAIVAFISFILVFLKVVPDVSMIDSAALTQQVMAVMVGLGGLITMIYTIIGRIKATKQITATKQ